jgi:uncharacterized membrane protein YeaQ/YmgE (transglycosylase-associated protein family)
MIGALLLGLVAGFIGRALVPNDIFAGMHGPRSWLISVVLGLVGAIVGWAIFTAGLGIGDEAKFDWGGLLSALIGVIIVLVLAGWIARRTGTVTPRDRRRGTVPPTRR